MGTCAGIAKCQLASLAIPGGSVVKSLNAMQETTCNAEDRRFDFLGKTEGGGSLNILFHHLLGGQAVLAVTLVPTMKGSCSSD